MNEEHQNKIEKVNDESSRDYWDKVIEKRLKKTHQALIKYTEKELKRNKLSIEDNLMNGVKLLEESFKSTNSEYWHDKKNKDNNNKEDNDPKFLPWINDSNHQLVNIDTIKQREFEF